VTVVTVRPCRSADIWTMNGQVPGKWMRFAAVCLLCIGFAVIVAFLIQHT